LAILRAEIAVSSCSLCAFLRRDLVRYTNFLCGKRREMCEETEGSSEKVVPLKTVVDSFILKSLFRHNKAVNDVC
jgi:hypothetical protein